MKNLTSVIIKNSNRGRKLKTKKEAFLSALAFLIVFGFVGGIMCWFSFLVTSRLAVINQAYAFTNILLLMNFLILFTKSVFESLNVLYFSKDLRVLLRMPIPSINIVHSKIFNMIITEYQMELIMLAIPMSIYGILMKVSVMFYVDMLLILLVLPIIPILITSLIIAVIMRFTNSIKNKSKAMYITIIFSMFLIGILTSFNTNQDFSVSSFTNIILEANGLSESIADSFALIRPIMNILTQYDSLEGIKNLGIYILESIICYIVVVYLISKIYLKGAIGATINSNRENSGNFEKLNLNDFKKKNKYRAYLSKEWKSICRTPIFFIQCILMPIIYPILVFVVVIGLTQFAKAVGMDLWAKLYDVAVTSFGLAIVLGVGQVFYMMNFTSIIAISRESKNAIISKFIPIKIVKQFNLKIFIGLVTNTISTILICVFYYMCTKNINFTIFILLGLILINVFGEKIKLLIDLNKPQLAWDSEYTMMKQNTNVMYELFYTLIVGGILYVVSKIFINALYFIVCINVILIIINIIITRYIKKNYYEIFSKIY